VWHQIIVRRAGFTFRLWYDGASIATINNSDPVPTSMDGLLIGKRNPGEPRGFAVNGRIDEVAIWNRAISNDEIAALYNGGIGNPMQGPAASALFVTGRGIYANDAWRADVASDTSFSDASPTVPEPSSIALSLFAVAAAMSRRLLLARPTRPILPSRLQCAGLAEEVSV
jgi:hypothetical protein